MSCILNVHLFIPLNQTCVAQWLESHRDTCCKCIQSVAIMIQGIICIIRPICRASLSTHPCPPLPDLSRHNHALSSRLAGMPARRNANKGTSHSSLPPPQSISCCSTMLYTLALSSVNARLVLRSRSRSPSSISVDGFEARSSSTLANYTHQGVSFSVHRLSFPPSVAVCEKRWGRGGGEERETQKPQSHTPASCCRPAVRIPRGLPARGARVQAWRGYFAPLRVMPSVGRARLRDAWGESWFF